MRPQGGRAKGLGSRPFPDPHFPRAWLRHPTSTQDPTLGLWGSCRATTAHLTHPAAATPTPCHRSGPGDAVYPPEGPDLPLIPVCLISTSPVPSLLSTSCAGPKGMCEGKASWKPRSTFPRSQNDLGEELLPHPPQYKRQGFGVGGRSSLSVLQFTAYPFQK